MENENKSNSFLFDGLEDVLDEGFDWEEAEEEAKKEEKEREEEEKRNQYTTNHLERLKTIKKKPGPKVINEMSRVTYNIEAELAEAINEYCEENNMRRSPFVRNLLKKGMEELGYRFSFK